MSKKLALSSLLSVLLMTGFAVFNDTSLPLGGEGATSALLPAKAEIQTPAMPELPILR